MKTIGTLIAITVVLLLIYYTLALIIFLVSTGLFRVISHGGSDSYCPNTISYVFEETVKENIIVAPHTFYSVLDGDCLRDAEAHPLKFMLQSSDKCKFVQPEACYGGSISDAEEIEQEVRFLKGISHGICFVDDKEAKRIKKELNACIREDREVDDYAFGCHSQLIRFWKLQDEVSRTVLQSRSTFLHR